MVENAFGILKKNFKELMCKSYLNVIFLSNVFTYCCLLHNLLKIQDEVSIEHLLHIIELETNTLHEDQTINIP